MPRSSNIHATRILMIASFGATRSRRVGLCALNYCRSRRFCFHLSPSTVPVLRVDVAQAFTVGRMEDVSRIGGRS
jgi:hypothetical protein